MPLAFSIDTVLYGILIGGTLLLLSLLVGLLAFYLGLLPVFLLEIGIGLPLAGLVRLLQVVVRRPWDGRRAIDTVVGLLQCAGAVYCGRVLLLHQGPHALSLQAHVMARSLAEMPLVQLCLGCSGLIGCAVTGLGVVVAGRAFVARLVHHLIAEG
jgi:hypothetical protein